MIHVQNIDVKMIANNLDPFEPTHPGDLLKDEIECRHITQKQFAAEIGISYPIVNEILNGKKAVNTRFALLCEAALGVPAQMLMSLQADYDLQTAKQNKSFMTRLIHVRNITAML